MLAGIKRHIGGNNCLESVKLGKNTQVGIQWDLRQKLTLGENEDLQRRKISALALRFE